MHIRASVRVLTFPIQYALIARLDKLNRLLPIPLFDFTTLRYALLLALALGRGTIVAEKILPGT